MIFYSYCRTVLSISSPTMLDKFILRWFLAVSQNGHFQMFSNHGPWTVYNSFYPVATEVTSNLLSLAWRLRLHPIVDSNAPKPNPIDASLRLAFHHKCTLSARKCIAQNRLKFQINHCQFFSGPVPGIIAIDSGNYDINM